VIALRRMRSRVASTPSLLLPTVGGLDRPLLLRVESRHEPSCGGDDCPGAWSHVSTTTHFPALNRVTLLLQSVTRRVNDVEPLAKGPTVHETQSVTSASRERIPLSLPRNLTPWPASTTT